MHKRELRPKIFLLVEIRLRLRSIKCGARSTFPGLDLFKIIVERFGPTDLACKEFFHHSDLKTWFSDWQIQNKRISPIQSRAIISKAESLLHHITEIEKDISFVLPKYYSYQTNDEWLCTFLFPLKSRLTEIITKIK